MSVRPTISVVIPSRDGVRGGRVAELRVALARQTWSPVDVAVVVGMTPAARARNEGVRQTRGELIAFFDDDAGLCADDLLERLAIVLIERDDVGLVGAAQVSPQPRTRFQERFRRQFARAEQPPVDTLTDSDMVTTICCMTRRALFRELEGFDERVVAGEDNLLRAHIREHGLRVVLAPSCVVTHPLPATLRELWARAVWYGHGGAQLVRLGATLPETRTFPRSLTEARADVLKQLLAFPVRCLFAPSAGGSSWRLAWRPLWALSVIGSSVGAWREWQLLSERRSA